MNVTEDIDHLVTTFAAKSAALESEFQVMATALAWSLVSAVLRGEIPRSTIPLDKPRGTKMTDERDDNIDDDADTLRLTKRPSKRVRFVELLETRTGKWARRDSDNVYKCVGPADAPDHFHMSLEGGRKVLVVSLVSILSKWNHIP